MIDHSETVDANHDARRRLLEASIPIFADKGYEASSVREICQRAETNIASVNYYFRDKENLYIEACKFAHLSSSDGGCNELQAVDESQLPIVQLRQYIRAMVLKMHTPADPHAVALMMRELANPSAAGREVVTLFIQPSADRLYAILKLMVPNLDEHHLLMIGFSVMGQVLFYRQNRKVTEMLFGPHGIGELTADMVSEHITRFTLAALGHATPIGGAL
jgi:TetR/AcrR family transcriptional regulator, regulator of cefoperazone and chloramphenicol sensitivity